MNNLMVFMCSLYHMENLDKISVDKLDLTRGETMAHQKINGLDSCSMLTLSVAAVVVAGFWDQNPSLPADFV
jgi:hypothetical protein